MKTYSPIRLPILLSATILTVAVVLWATLVILDRTRVERTIELQAEKVQQFALGQVPYAAPYMGDIVWDWLRNGQPPEAKWKTVARRELRIHPACLALVWIDPSYQTRWIAAQKDEAFVRQLDFQGNLQWRAILDKTRGQMDAVIPPSADIPEIGRVVTAFVPLKRERAFEGFILGVFCIQEHLHTIFAEIAPGYAISIWDSQGEVYHRSETDEAYVPELGVEKEFSFYDATWRLRIWPSKALLAKESSPFPNAALGVGLLMGLLLPSIVYLAQTTRLRAREVEATNQELKREVIERKQAEAALRESEERYRLLFDVNPHPMWVHDLATLSFLTVNDAAVRQYGYSRSEFLSMTIRDIRPEEDVPRLLDALSRTPQTLDKTVWKHRRKDRTTLSVEITSHEFLFGGRPARLVQAVDITERERLAEQLRQSQKMEAIGQLAGGVAHDFNNLLTVITGYCDLLLMTAPPGDSSVAAIEEIRKAGHRAAGLTQQLLAFSRKQILEPKVINLNTVVADVEKLLRRVIGEHIDLATVFTDDLRTVKADPGQIQQVILNLAVNARDAMPEGGKLTIETANVHLDESYAATHVDVQPGPHVMLAVSDTGCGMTPDTIARVFEPFFTTKEVGKGTGMGLATVYGIVRQSGGSINVYSEPGKGTAFKVYLPSIVAECQFELELPDLDDAPSGTETILVVEDEEAVRGLTCRILKARGYTVLEASRPKDAILLCQQSETSIQLLVTDVVMPEMSGPELAAQLTASQPALNVLFVSGYADQAIVRHGILDSDTAFLRKPFSPVELARKVREVLDASVPCLA